jgi:hypothetical protein
VADLIDCQSDPVVDPFGWTYCDVCKVSVPIFDQFDDQEGYEEQARPVRVIVLACDHDIVTSLRRWPGG